MSIFVLKKFQRPSLHLFDTGDCDIDSSTSRCSAFPAAALRAARGGEGRAPTSERLASAWRGGGYSETLAGRQEALDVRRTTILEKMFSSLKNNVVPKFPFKVKRPRCSHCCSPNPAAGQSQGPLLSL